MNCHRGAWLENRNVERRTFVSFVNSAAHERREGFHSEEGGRLSCKRMEYSSFFFFLRDFWLENILQAKQNEQPWLGGFKNRIHPLTSVECQSRKIDAWHQNAAFLGHSFIKLWEPRWGPSAKRLVSSSASITTKGDENYFSKHVNQQNSPEINTFKGLPIFGCGMPCQEN